MAYMYYLDLYMEGQMKKNTSIMTKRITQVKFKYNSDNSNRI